MDHKMWRSLPEHLVVEVRRTRRRKLRLRMFVFYSIFFVGASHLRPWRTGPYYAAPVTRSFSEGWPEGLFMTIFFLAFTWGLFRSHMIETLGMSDAKFCVKCQKEYPLNTEEPCAFCHECLLLKSELAWKNEAY